MSEKVKTGKVRNGLWPACLAVGLGLALGVWLWLPVHSDLAVAGSGQVHRWEALPERLGVRMGGIHAWEQAQDQEIDAWWGINFDEGRLPGEDSTAVNWDHSIVLIINCMNTFRLGHGLSPLRESYVLIRLARNRARLYADLSVDGVDTALCKECVEVTGRMSFGGTSCTAVGYDEHILGNYSHIGAGLVNGYVVVILRPEAASQ